jgi:hypothetical protein
MNARRHLSRTAIVLYVLALLALIAVSLSLDGGETDPRRWALIAIPAALVAAASLTTGEPSRSRATCR